MGVIANGGEAAEPYLMQKISRAGQTVYEAETKTTGRLLSEETAEALGKMMRGAVVNQYGAWQFGSLTVCAKSGTAAPAARQPRPSPQRSLPRARPCWIPRTRTVERLDSRQTRKAVVRRQIHAAT